MDMAEELSQLAKLHSDGVLTDEEFAQQKAVVLERANKAKSAPPRPVQAPDPIAAAFHGPKNRTTAGLLAIFLGGFGAHKFYLGYQNAAIIHLVVCFVGSLLIIGPFVIGVISLIEGISYLSKTEEDFHNTYVANKKEWF